MSKPRSRPSPSTPSEPADPPARPAAPEPARSGRVAIIGRPNVGKSTLLNALLGEPIAIISDHPQTTRDTVRGVLTAEGAQFVFVDTPGLHQPKTRLGQWMNETARQAMREADVLVLVVEGPREGRVPRPVDADLAIAGELPPVPTVLAINKVDLVKDKTKLLPLLAAFAEKHTFAASVPISAKRTNGTDRLLREIRAVLPEQPFLFEGDTLSDQPVRFFVAEFVREQILKQTFQEVPHGVAVVVERFDESGSMPQIEVAVHVAREAHKKILIGAKGQMMKAIGTAARARVEQMLSRKVHIQIWVRSTPGWMDDPARLKDLGYS
jgi:GTP-binding protein Era